MIRFLSIISLMLILLSLAIIYINFADTKTALIVRWDAYRHLTYLGDRNDVLRIAVSGWLLIFFNIFLIRMMEKKLPSAAKILSWGTVLLSLLILVVISIIILSN